ncbi:MAG: CNNM domain-containing protein [Bacteroidales bacterium]|nr:CNNM domain-containing protein [Bacteroidales bacterium]MCL2133657.1 CNNM domain-containing protein [Bacteroidales bacterium]
MESVLLSTPISFINMKEAEGHKQASALKDFKENINKPLAAILSVNTIANTIGAAGVGAQAATLFGNSYFGIISAILTLLILIFSEIIPKTIGSRFYRQLAMRIVVPLKCLIFIAYPFVLLSKLIAKTFGTDENEATVSREEVSAMANLATDEGEVEVKENKVIQNIMRLETIKVEDIMTPQIVVLTASEDLTVSAFHRDKSYLNYSRIPVYEEDNEDNITGYVLQKTVLDHLANDDFLIKLKDIRRNIVIAREGLSITTLWETLLKEKEHIALIVDEYGSFAGIVTMEDIIESILGLEIVDETDSIEDMQQYARQKWQERSEKYKHIISEPAVVQLSGNSG